MGPCLRSLLSVLATVGLIGREFRTKVDTMRVRRYPWPMVRAGCLPIRFGSIGVPSLLVAVILTLSLLDINPRYNGGVVMFPGLIFDWSDCEYKSSDPFDPFPDVEQLELAYLLDRQNLTKGGSDGLKLFCNACEVLAEVVQEDFEPETIWCPRCSVNGMSDVVFEAADIHIKNRVESNESRAGRRGIGKRDFVADAEDQVRHGNLPIIPAFVWKRLV